MKVGTVKHLIIALNLQTQLGKLQPLLEQGVEAYQDWHLISKSNKDRHVTNQYYDWHVCDNKYIFGFVFPFFFFLF